MATAAAMDLSEYENDPRLFLFTSLTAGSSHVITATSRMETILKANRIPFQAIDLATDEKARRLWQRRGQKKKLPGLVKDGFVLGDLEEVEEWNEFGELKENIGPVPATNAAPAGSSIQGVSTAPPIDHNVPGGQSAPAQPLLNRPIPPPSAEETRVALPGAAEIAAMSKAKKEKEAAAKAAASDSTTTPVVATDGPAPETMSSAPAAKEASVSAAKMETPTDPPAAGHLSTPASAAQEAATSDPAAAVISPQASTDEAALPPVEQAGAATLTHRGSEVKEASPEEIKKLEEANALQEATDEEDGAEKAAVRGVQDLSVESKGEETTQEQEATQGADAGKSVED